MENKKLVEQLAEVLEGISETMKQNISVLESFDNTLMQIHKTMIRVEVLTLLSKSRTQKQISFAFDSIKSCGEYGVNYFFEMIKRTHSPDKDLIREMEYKYNKLAKELIMEN